MLLKQAVVHDGLGAAAVCDVRIENGLIAQVAPHIDGEGIDLTGMHLLPGFIDTLSKWGINGTAYEIRPSSDDNDEKSEPVTPELDVIYAFNGRAVSVQQLPAYGITACGVAPSDNNVFGGQAAAFETDGVNGYTMCLRRGVGLKCSLAREVKRVYGGRSVMPSTRMGIFQLFGSWLRKADAYDPDKEGVEPDEKLAAIRRTLRGEMPLILACDSANDRALAMDILKPYPDVRVIFTSINGMDEQDLALDPARVSFVTGFAGGDLDPRSMNRRYDVLTKLMDRGVHVAVSGMDGTSYSREWVLWEGMELTRHIADTERVLSMMTIEPARLLGIDAQTGSISVGKRADLTVFTMNPLTDFRARVVRTMIAGRTVYQEGDEIKCYC